jgi:hypothetical protein
VLRDLAVADEALCRSGACKPRQVVGIYLGWRGLSNPWEPFNTLSFWTRKSRAHRVGTDGAPEVLAELSKINAANSFVKANPIPRKLCPDGVTKTFPADLNRLILVGHSFGGALIYTATQQSLIRDSASLVSSAIRRNTADLVVLINPAFEAARFRTLHDRGAMLAPTLSSTQPPVLAIFTSKGDAATKVAFPIGRGLNTLFESHPRPGQRAENRTAVGHYPPFITHQLVVGKNGLNGVEQAQDEAAVVERFRQARRAWLAYKRGTTDSWDIGDVCLVPKAVTSCSDADPQAKVQPPEALRNPYMVIHVDNEIITGHNQIWAQHFSNFLYQFVAMQFVDQSNESCHRATAEGVVAPA